MARDRVLVVDDEELNLVIIKEFLDSEEIDLETELDPLVAWEKLQAPASDYSLVVLDRMMPGLDGLDLLRRIRTNPRYQEVPVIMQTAAAAPEQVREGLEAGAYYYLTKPYEPEALISIVRGALADRNARLTLRHQVGHLDGALRLLTRASYRFRSLEDVALLVPALASLCQKPEMVAPGLSDLMVNAVEHGNLGVTYQEKSLLRWEGDWEGEIARRLALPQFADRWATVQVERSADSVVYTIRDEGDGFDWQPYLEFDPERVFDPNGRGIAMAKMTSFTSLEYQGIGNVVVASVVSG